MKSAWSDNLKYSLWNVKLHDDSHEHKIWVVVKCHVDSHYTKNVGSFIILPSPSRSKTAQCPQGRFVRLGVRASDGGLKRSLLVFHFSMLVLTPTHHKQNT
mmetsp:Transcript_21330/g.44516  ORF Transcript_21330/g.44516 Transcript_21330/m.44516 type:complete len:101 (-) Transcript_21330:1026-1328(-)